MFICNEILAVTDILPDIIVFIRNDLFIFSHSDFDPDSNLIPVHFGWESKTDSKSESESNNVHQPLFSPFFLLSSHVTCEQALKWSESYVHRQI